MRHNAREIWSYSIKRRKYNLVIWKKIMDICWTQSEEKTDVEHEWKNIRKIYYGKEPGESLGKNKFHTKGNKYI